MKVNVVAAVVETPDKKRPGELVSPDRVLVQFQEERHSPSLELRSMLNGIARLHNFCHSSSDDLIAIDDIRLQLKTKDLICDLFNDYQEDLKDWILEKEKSLTETEIW